MNTSRVMTKNILRSWGVGMVIAYILLACHIIPQNTKIGLVTRPLILPVPVAGVAMNELYAPLIARHFGLIALAVMLGGVIFGAPIFLLLHLRSKGVTR